MAGRNKLTPKKIFNLGLQPLNEKTGNLVDLVSDKKHPMEILLNDKEFMEALENESWDDFKKDAILKLKLLHKELTAKTLNNVHKIAPHRLPYALEMIGNQIAKLQGEPSQRIEVSRGKMTYDEFNELYKHLPKKTKAEVIDSGGIRARERKEITDVIDSTGRLGTTDGSDHTKGQKGD